MSWHLVHQQLLRDHAAQQAPRQVDTCDEFMLLGAPTLTGASFRVNVLLMPSGELAVLCGDAALGRMVAALRLRHGDAAVLRKRSDTQLVYVGAAVAPVPASLPAYDLEALDL